MQLRLPRSPDSQEKSAHHAPQVRIQLASHRPQFSLLQTLVSMSMMRVSASSSPAKGSRSLLPGSFVVAGESLARARAMDSLMSVEKRNRKRPSLLSKGKRLRAVRLLSRLQSTQTKMMIQTGRVSMALRMLERKLLLPSKPSHRRTLK
jgi:hypothetical protein